MILLVLHKRSPILIFRLTSASVAHIASCPQWNRLQPSFRNRDSIQRVCQLSFRVILVVHINQNVRPVTR